MKYYDWQLAFNLTFAIVGFANNLLLPVLVHLILFYLCLRRKMQSERMELEDRRAAK